MSEPWTPSTWPAPNRVYLTRSDSMLADKCSESILLY